MEEMLKKLRMLIRTRRAQLIVILIFKFLPTMKDRGLNSTFVNQEVAIETGVTSSGMDEL